MTVLVAAIVGAGFGVVVARPRRVGATDPRGVAAICDLWAAALDAGVAPVAGLDGALAASGWRAERHCPVAHGPANESLLPAPGGAPDEVLAQVVGLLRLGADPARAWQPAADHQELAPLAAAVVRSDASGADLASAVRAQAGQLRRCAASSRETRAARAVVLMAGPLTLCFLPAFICLGLAPIVIALIGSLDIVR